MKEPEKANDEIPEIPSECHLNSKRILMTEIPFFMKESSDQCISSPRKENLRMINKESATERIILREIFNTKKDDDSMTIESPCKIPTIIHHNGLVHFLFML